MKISDEFWIAADRGNGHYCIIDSAGLFLAWLPEKTARHICDLHNAALVQERRGWHAEKCTESEQWLNSKLLAEVMKRWWLLQEAIEACYGPTPHETMLNGNRWMEQHEASEVKP